MSWRVEEEGWQPLRAGHLFQSYSNPVSPLGHLTSGSAPTNLPPPPFRQRVSNTRYRPVSSLVGVGGSQSHGEEEEEAGLKKGVGESGLGQVLAPCNLHLLGEQTSGCTLPDWDH